MTSANPFTEPGALPSLYDRPDRLQRRSGSLMAAKVQGPNATTTIVSLATALTPSGVALDIGCGRGSTSSALAAMTNLWRVFAVDWSPALLATTRRRVPQARAVRCDFHHLPITSGAVDLAVAAFCLYHSPHPEDAVAEIARCLTSRGHAILVTKSADSYSAIDNVLQASGLDPQAADRPSLYTSFHSANAAHVAATALQVEHVRHEDHAFRFGDFDHLATYVSTSPKYELPQSFATSPTALANELRRRLPEQPVLASSTVTYVVASKP